MNQRQTPPKCIWNNTEHAYTLNFAHIFHLFYCCHIIFYFFLYFYRQPCCLPLDVWLAHFTTLFHKNNLFIQYFTHQTTNLIYFAWTLLYKTCYQVTASHVCALTDLSRHHMLLIKTHRSWGLVCNDKPLWEYIVGLNVWFTCADPVQLPIVYETGSVWLVLKLNNL